MAASRGLQLLAEPLAELGHLLLRCCQLPYMAGLQLSQGILQRTELQQQQRRQQSCAGTVGFSAASR